MLHTLGFLEFITFGRVCRCCCSVQSDRLLRNFIKRSWLQIGIFPSTEMRFYFSL